MCLKKRFISLLLVFLLLCSSLAFSLSESETLIIGKLKGDLTAALIELQSLKELLTNYKIQLTDLQTSLNGSAESIATLETLIQTLETEIVNKEKSLTELSVQQETLTAQSVELKAELKALSDMQTSLQRENKKYRTGFYIVSGVACVLTVGLVVSLIHL